MSHQSSERRPHDDSAVGPAGATRRAPRADRRTAALTRSVVLQRAVAMADEFGVGAVTMRALARSLGVTAMALYAHVDDKDDVLDAVLDARLRGVGLPAADSPWRSWIDQFSRDLRAQLVAEPALLERYCRRPVSVTAALDRLEAALNTLLRAGFDDAAAVAALAAVHTYTIGFAALESSRRGHQTPESPRANFRDDSLPGFWPTYFASLDGASYPQLARLRPDLVAFTSDEQFRTGLAALLDGLQPTMRTSGLKEIR